MLSASLYELKDLHLNETIVESGSAINSKCGLLRIYLHNFYTDSNNFFVHSINPYSPRSKNEPHAALRHPPFRDPRAVGEI